MRIEPKKRRIGHNKISPRELRDMMRRLMIFENEIARDVNYEERESSIGVTDIGRVDEGSGIFFTENRGLLSITYDIFFRLKLENDKPDISDEIFGQTIEEKINEFKKDKEFMKSDFIKKVMKKMEELLEKHSKKK